MRAQPKSILRILLKPTVAAGVLGVLITLWLVTGEKEAKLPGPPVTAAAAESESGPLLETRWSKAQPVREELRLRGQLEPLRVVRLRAETEGRVVEVPVRKGDRVPAGGVVVRLALNDRLARRSEAVALLERRREEARASERLLTEGVIGAAVARERQVELATAEARLQSVEVEIDHATLKAPFAAVLNERGVEIGDFVDRGDVVAMLVDDSSLLVTAQVPQQHVGKIASGEPATARLVSGEELVGVIRYVSRVGDADTRSFRVEVVVANAGRGLVTGTSLELVLPLGETDGHLVPASALTTTSDGRLAVTTVGAHGRVELSAIELIRSASDGVWVAGLPNEVAVIVAGQGFTVPGQMLTGTATPEQVSSIARLLPGKEGPGDARVH